jgi:hypothetical protein
MFGDELSRISDIHGSGTCLILVTRFRGVGGAILAQFLQSKSHPCRAAPAATVTLKIEEVNMGYLIAVAVLAMMSLYALIIVQGLSQPEW